MKKHADRKNRRSRPFDEIRVISSDDRQESRIRTDELRDAYAEILGELAGGGDCDEFVFGAKALLQKWEATVI